VNLADILAALGLANTIIHTGSELWGQIKTILQSNGIEADYAALDAMVADAEARKARAQTVVDGANPTQ